MQDEVVEQEEELALGLEKLIVVGLIKIYSSTSFLLFRRLHHQDAHSAPLLSETTHVLTFPQLPGATETAVSFQIEKEDHTLGNTLRYFINKKSALQPVCTSDFD